MSTEGQDLQNDIEALLKQVEEQTAADASANLKAAAPAVAVPSAQDDADRLLAEIAAEATDELTAPPRADVHSLPRAQPKGEAMTPDRSGVLNLDLSGEITIDLKLHFGNQTVYLSCDTENLLVQLGDGTQFRLPIQAPKVNSSAA